MKYYIVAGERSGDLHASNLVKALKQRDPHATFRGFGGDYMQEQGVELAVHYRDLAFMGFAELVTNAFKIRRYIRQCREDITAFRPDVIILVDYGGFNLQIAKFGKKQGYKVYFYILPKYWAWWPSRALWLKPHVDKLFIILPFEKTFFKKFEWESYYVGNPVLDAVKSHVEDDNFLPRHTLHDRPYVALLPGSRKQELLQIVPELEKVVQRMSHQHFCVAAVNNLDSSLYGDLPYIPNVTMVFEDTYNLLLHARAAVVTSGTATLETALFRVPQVVVYKANALTYGFARFLVRVKFISLVNLIAGREVVRELIQSDMTAANLYTEVSRLVAEGDYRKDMLLAYDEIITVLDTGSASENTASLMIQFLQSN
ncbi:MAG TPA: lipid-A-disaccharide synthase [Chryseolinea sp.]|nr:lipid-A-disaccharide synthase [Chryseolinea sp.]